ncbi:LytTR family DNA-binding domain-containing protein [Reichenbachiella sp. MALMAid0571]|uniref:LytR/AlgR family response regulator transcription factor n=1 Tax=Reichenbachiella sp. MALMAid0571 TaxID=3143939 RepID=UPI0032DE547C
MTRVLIIEDEFYAAQKLIRQLQNIDPEVEILDTLDSVDESIDWLKNHSADLIFLDIHLGDDQSFKIFEKIKIKTPIIFTTAYDQYAIKAFKLNSIDYLLKPVNKKELQQALKKFHEQNLQSQAFDYKALLTSLQSGESLNYQKRFLVYYGDKVKSISNESIAYFFAEGKYAYLVGDDGKEYIVDYTLEKLDNMLDPEKFFRINRQYIISINSIKEMITYTKGRLKIELKPETKKEAIVSIERASEFKKWLNK